MPGVPLGKLTPAWIPLRLVWGYLTGAILLVAGAGMLVNKQARTAAVWLGAAITLLVLFIYLPILAVAVQSPGNNGRTELCRGYIALRRNGIASGGGNAKGQSRAVTHAAGGLNNPPQLDKLPRKGR